MTRTRRHHNNWGLRQIQRGKTARLPKKLGRILIKQGGEMKEQKESPPTVADEPENTPEVSATAGEMSRGKTVSDDILHEQRVRIAAADRGTDKALADILGPETHCFEISRAIGKLLDDPPQCTIIDTHGLADGVMNVLYLAGEIYFVPVHHANIDHYVAVGDVAHVFCKKTGKFEDLTLLNGGLKPENREPLPWSLLCNGCHRQFREIPADTAKRWLEIRENRQAADG